jgi:hypothetical protein
MTQEYDQPDNEESLNQETTLRDWERPALYRLTADSAEASFAGIGADLGIYS